LADLGHRWWVMEHGFFFLVSTHVNAFESCNRYADPRMKVYS
jgi:hypothetical protein